jgi:adenylate cyclase
MVRGLRERERLKDAFNRYVSRQVYEKFQAGEIALSGENRHATVLFSDIRSFTTLSEQLTPTEVVAMLNEYFNVMVEIVLKYDGFLNKFIGDALMAIYNVPLDQTAPELRAVCTAIEMMQSLDLLNADRERRGQFPIKIGIGINTGPVVAGNIGHEKRLEYTVIGDAVNTAQRLESQTKVAGVTILLSEATYQAVASYVDATALPPVKVKGKAEPVALYAVNGIKPGVTLPFTAVNVAAASDDGPSPTPAATG